MAFTSSSHLHNGAAKMQKAFMKHSCLMMVDEMTTDQILFQLLWVSDKKKGKENSQCLTAQFYVSHTPILLPSSRDSLLLLARFGLYSVFLLRFNHLIPRLECLP